jgi:prepilin-type N-terminal cleavage/methylation domain-containing protein
MTLRKVGTEVRRPPARGFTLIELLVVILIILAVSAIALPTVIPAISHRQVSEAARLLQASLVGARDAALHSNAPRGIRLLPDPGYFAAISPTTGQPDLPRLANGRLDPASILAANRIIPIESAPDYSEGRLDYYNFNAGFHKWTAGNPPPYPGPHGSAPYDWYPVPYTGYSQSWTDPLGRPHNPNVLCVVESALDPNTLLPHSPTSWFWNIRLGDKIRIADSTTYFTVVGPMTVYPGNPNPQFEGNPELFINDGPPGSVSQLMRYYPNYPNQPPSPVEYLFLVNGVDDDNNGFVDDGWDGVDNNRVYGIDDLDEWEHESWLPAARLSQTYTIRRRPVPSANTKEIPLPSNIVVDLTTWSTTMERSRLPVNAYTGYADILLNPTGDVVPTTLYSSPSTFGLAGSFYHFWLAERADVAAPLDWTTHPNLNSPPDHQFHLPMPADTPNSYGGPTYDQLRAQYPDLGELKGERRLVTLNTRTGQISTNSIETEAGLVGANLRTQGFDVHIVNLPFTAAQQGAQGGP